MPDLERATRNARHRDLDGTRAARSVVRFPGARLECQEFTGHRRHESCEAQPFFFMRARRNIGVEGVDTIGIGLWDRNRELDMITMGLPRLTGCWKALHVPLFVVHTSWQSMYRTVDDDLGLLRWSNGPGDSRCEPPRNATTSHHGPATTCSTKRRAGRQLLCRGLVSQVTGGDWNCLKTSSSFPKHKTTHGCRPWCEVTPAQLRDVPSTAPWRRRRLEHWGIIVRSRRRVFVLCLLFGHQASTAPRYAPTGCKSLTSASVPTRRADCSAACWPSSPDGRRRNGWPGCGTVCGSCMELPLRLQGQSAHPAHVEFQQPCAEAHGFSADRFAVSFQPHRTWLWNS